MGRSFGTSAGVGRRVLAACLLATGLSSFIAPSLAGASAAASSGSSFRPLVATHRDQPRAVHFKQPAVVVAPPKVTPKLLSATPRVPTAPVAASFTVDTDEDSGLATASATTCVDALSGKCSLRAAVEAADNGDGHTYDIDFASGINPVLSGTDGPLPVSGSIVIDGSGHSVSGDNETQVFAEEPGKGPAPALEVNGLEITDGLTYNVAGSEPDPVGIGSGAAAEADTPGGGALFCEGGTAVLSDVDVTGNASIVDNVDGDDEDAFGGGLYVDTGCSLWLESSVVSSNLAVATYGNDDANGVVHHSAVACDTLAEGGVGGGLFVDGGAAYIIRTLVGGTSQSGCNVAEDGAGILNDGSMVVQDSSIDYNASGSTAELDGDGDGVGIENVAVIDVSGSSIDHNISYEGGEGVGFANFGREDIEEKGAEGAVADVTDTSLSFNVNSDVDSSPDDADLAGAAVFDDGSTMTMVGDTIDHNSTIDTADSEVGGGAVFSESETFVLENSQILDTSIIGSDFVDGGALFLNSVTDTIRNTTISGTSSNTTEGVDGGAIFTLGGREDVGVAAGHVDPTLLDGVTITGTTASGEEVDGGALFAVGPVVMEDTSVSSTLAESIISSGSQVGDNEDSLTGGALDFAFDEGTATLEGVTVAGTDAVAELAKGVPDTTGTDVYGGAIYMDAPFNGTDVSIVRTTAIARGVEGDIEGGVIADEDSGTWDNTQALDATVEATGEIEGGLLYNDEEADNLIDFTLGSSTVKVVTGSDVKASGAFGSIVYNEGLLDSTNVTLANVTTSIPSGSEGDFAVANGFDGVSQFTNSTIGDDTFNGPKGEAALVFDEEEDVITLTNSIVDAGYPSLDALNCILGKGGTISSVGYNLDSGHSCGFDKPGDIENHGARLLPLADNGGEVETAALLPNFYGPYRAGSPAINAGSNSACPPFDARGVSRPQDDTCDLGAYEVPAQGYWLTSLAGGLYHFGAGGDYGSVLALIDKHVIGALGGPIDALAATTDHHGYFQAGSDGGVFAFGDARFGGSLARLPLAARIVGIATDATGGGYWTTGAEGHVYPFGDATYYGSEDYNIVHEPVAGIASTHDGLGYWLATADGNVLSFGDAVDYGSPLRSGITVAAPIVAIATTPDGKGYWLVGEDGGIFAYGDAKYWGSEGGKHLNKPIIGIAATPDGFGYWLFAADGGVFSFGDAQFLGSLGATALSSPVSGAVGANY